MKYWPFPMSNPNGKVGEYANIAEVASKLGVRFLHMQGDKVSCTVAYRPVKPTKNCKMLEVSVTYKHPNDQYNRKVGAELAAQRFLAGETVVMPLKRADNYETMNNIRAAFMDSVGGY